MKRRLSGVAGVLGVVLITLMMSSCAGVTKKGYEGVSLPPDKTATVQSGPYTTIQGIDGAKLAASQLNVTVLPGKHTIEIAYPPAVTDYVAFYYSNVTGSITFDAEAGHRYLAYTHRISPDLWVAYVRDKTSGERVAQSEPLPLKVEWLYRRNDVQ